jgi:hypothetical protein
MATSDPEKSRSATLSLSELVILKALVERIIPPTTWDCNAGMVAKIDLVLGSVRKQLLFEFRLLLFVLEYVLPLLSLKGRFFTRMPAQEKDAYLDGLEKSSLQIKRTCFQAIKRAAIAAFYGSDESWPALHYLGPWLKRGYPFEYEGKGIQVPK